MFLTTTKLKTRIVVLTTLVFVVVVTLGSLFAGHAVFHHSQKTLLQQQSLLQNLVVRQINDGLQHRLDALQVLSDQLHDGEGLLDLNSMQKVLDSRVLLHGDFNGGLVIMDADARMIVDSPVIPGRVGTDLSDREHAKQVRATRKPMITHPLIGRGLKVPVFVISVPILAENGHFLGYILGVTRLDESNTLTQLTPEVYDSSGSIYVIDFSNNVFVTSNHTQFAMQALPNIEQNELLRRIHAGESNGLAQGFFDYREAFSAKKLELIDWYVVHTLPEAELNNSSWQLMKLLFLLEGLVALLFATLMYWLMRQQLKPLEQSAEKIHQMLEGKVPHSSLPVIKKDEVGILINAFNQKVAQLDEDASSRIRELNENFMAILNNTSDYIYFKDSEGRMKFCSQSLAKLTGHSHWREMEGKLDAELFPIENAAVYAEEEKVVYKQGLAIINHIAPYVNEQGEHAWVQTSKWPVFSADGRTVIGLFGISRDITKRIQLEESTQQALKNLKQAESLAKIGSWSLDLVSNSLSWSDEVYNIFEVEKEQFENTFDTFLALVHPDDQEIVNKTYRCSLEKKEKYTITYRILMQDGRVKYVEEQGKSTYDQSGNPISSYGTVQDVTEKWHADLQLRIAACAFETQEGILITDTEGTILRVNKAFTEITGYSSDEAEGKNPRILNSGKQTKSFYSEMWKAIKTEGRWEGEVWNRRKDGQVYPEWLRITAVKDSSGNLSHYIGTLVDITQSKAAVEQIEFLANYDSLTNLPNRRLLFDRLNHALISSKRNGSYGSLLFIDLDRFKTLNDTHGHPFGDLLLQQVSKRLLSNLREGDTVARIGGDEFVVLLENLSQDPLEAAQMAELVASKIQKQLNEVYLLQGLSYTTTNSIGVTIFSGKEFSSDELLKQADIAMYQAKSQMHGKIKFFDPEMQKQIYVREEMRQSLQQAIELKEFELYYQVQVDTNADLIGVEALIRWRHPEIGIIQPINFIPLAEETQLIIPLGQWVLETVCEQLQCWSNNPLTSSLVISINVSAIEFRQNNFVDQVLSTLKRYRIESSRLKLELTESMLVDSIDDTISKMRSLSEAGIHFALDDFGTGYSSLQYLKRLPINQLKIDQSFVKDIYQDSNDRTIVKTIISMAKGLGIDVIAEGVETQEQKDFLQCNGCEHYQGYLFGRPLPIDELEVLLKLKPGFVASDSIK